MAAAVVFAGVPVAPTTRLIARLGALDAPFIVAGDSGAATALAFGLRPDLVIGDFDSITAQTRARLEADGVLFETFPTAKDATDGELALLRAVESEPSEILLIGFVGGSRFDQTIANLHLAAQHRAVLLDEHNETAFLHGPGSTSWTATFDEVISLVPLVEARGVTTTNLRYPLYAETLPVGTSRGVSNEPLEPDVAVHLQGGVLAITRHFPRR